MTKIFNHLTCDLIYLFYYFVYFEHWDFGKRCQDFLQYSPTKYEIGVNEWVKIKSKIKH